LSLFVFLKIELIQLREENFNLKNSFYQIQKLNLKRNKNKKEEKDEEEEKDYYYISNQNDHDQNENEILFPPSPFLLFESFEMLSSFHFGKREMKEIICFLICFLFFFSLSLSHNLSFISQSYIIK